MNRASFAAAVLLAVACNKGPPNLSSEPTRFPRTDRKTWNKQGWEGLRWGMGPGDVEVHLGPKGMKLGGVYEPRFAEGRLKAFLLNDSARVLGGEKTKLEFRFLDDRLVSVGEDPLIVPIGAFQRTIRWAWNTRVSFAKACGEPKQEKDKDALQGQPAADRRYSAEWESGGTGRRVTLHTTGPSAFACAETFHVESEALARDEAERVVLEHQRRDAPKNEIKAVKKYAFRIGHIKRMFWLDNRYKPSEDEVKDAAESRSAVLRYCAYRADAASCEAFVKQIEKDPEAFEEWKGPGSKP